MKRVLVMLLFAIYSARREPVLQSLPALGTLKATDGGEWALAAAKAYNPAIVTVYRAIYTSRGKLDCSPTWGVGDPVAAVNRWYDMLVGVWASRGLLGQVEDGHGQPHRIVDYFEVRNECGFAGAWEVAFDQ